MNLSSLSQIISNYSRQFALHRLQILTVSAAACGVLAAGSLVQATHGYEAYAQSSDTSSNKSGTTYSSGYTIQESTAKGPGKSANTSAKSDPNVSGAGTTPIAAVSQTTSTSAATSSTAAATKSTAAAAKSPAPVPSPSGGYKYPLHTGIKTTWFYSGEPASADNDFIQNVSSAWQENWQSYYGGSDDPNNRCGYNPCAFTPRENPFYFALPFSDYTSTGQVHDLSMVYWYTGPFADGQSILKNRWIQITAAPGGVSKTVYAQWEDVGPFNEHDGAYVFGSSAPASTRAGLDISPATRDYLGMGGSTTSSWRFVDYSEVPAGPWKNTITSSAPDWN